jgi:hypothetical protein
MESPAAGARTVWTTVVVTVGLRRPAHRLATIAARFARWYGGRTVWVTGAGGCDVDHRMITWIVPPLIATRFNRAAGRTVIETVADDHRTLTWIVRNGSHKVRQGRATDGLGDGWETVDGSSSMAIRRTVI